MVDIAYFDCPTGISGDMCLGALVDAGVPLEVFAETLARLGVAAEVSLRTERVWRGGQEAAKVYVECLAPDERDGHPHRHLPEIEAMLRRAQLSPRTEQWSLGAFRRLAIAEGKVHGIAPEAVHFHEVGALDAIADIACTCAGFDWLGVERIFCSALPTGGGFVTCDHGRLPVPAPATLQLLQQHGVPVFNNGIEAELVTPTGAAIACTLCEGFGTFPAMTLERVGLGAGSREFAIANVLRLWLGNAAENVAEKKKVQTPIATPP